MQVERLMRALAVELLAVAAVTSLEVACEVGAPHFIGSIYVARGSARMSDGAALALLRDQAVAAEEVADGRAGRPGPVGLACTEERQPCLAPQTG